MTFEEAMTGIIGTNGLVSVARHAWKSPKMYVRHFSCYTRFTPFRSFCLASWYPKREDEEATDWYIRHQPAKESI